MKEYNNFAKNVIAQRTDNRWGSKVLEWQLCTGRRSVPPSRWCDDLVRYTGSRSMQVAQDRTLWYSLRERPMFSSGLVKSCNDCYNKIYICFRKKMTNIQLHLGY
ncbi:unnamed protein product [Parnassius mnemosyne]|uniref:Uncharacterized protein n=1 Tax=Parnassius mnemosyne TaxID=213953 RepID=A0AAV1L737_9NEOP